MLRLVLCVLAVAGAVLADFGPTSVVQTNVGAQRTTTATFLCNADTVGTHSLTDTDSLGNEQRIEVTCSPPAVPIRADFMGWLPSDYFVMRHSVCMTAAAVNDTTRIVSSGANKRRVRTAIDPVRGFIGGVFCAIGVGCSDKGIKRALEAIGKTVGDLTDEMGNVVAFDGQVLKYEDATNGALSSLNGEIGSVVRMGQERDRNIADLSKLVGQLESFTTGLADHVSADLTLLHGELQSLYNFTLGVENVTFAFHAETLQQIHRLQGQQFNAQRLLTAMAINQYQQYAGSEVRRILARLYWDDQEDVDITPITSKPFIADRGATPPPSASDVNHFNRSLDGAMRTASVSFQGTVDRDGTRWASQVDVELMCDPIVLLSSLSGSVDVRSIVDLIGPSGCNDDPQTTNTSEPIWQCVCVMAVTETRCPLADQDEVWPWDTSGQANGFDLRHSFELNSALPPTFCVQSGSSWDITDTATGTVESVEFLVPPRTTANPEYYTDRASLYSRFQTICEDGALDGTWVTHPTENVNVRIGSRHSDRFVQYDTGGGFAAVCDPDVESFADDPANNYQRVAWGMWEFMVASMQYTTTDTSQLDNALFGELPDNLTTVTSLYSSDSVTRASQRCEELVYVRVPETDDTDLDIRRVYKWVQTSKRRSQSTVRVVAVTSGNETSDAITSDPTTGAANGTLPVTGQAYHFSTTTSTVTDFSDFSPSGRLVIETPNRWFSEGVVYDVPYNMMSDSASAASQGGQVTYMMRLARNGNSTVTPDVYDKTTGMDHWIEQHASEFDARLVGDSPQQYARTIDNDQSCGFAIGRNREPVEGDTPNDHELCAFLNTHFVDRDEDDELVFSLVPIDDWSETITVVIPSGTISTAHVSACPSYEVIRTDAFARVILTNDLPSAVTFCARVTGGILPSAADPACENTRSFDLGPGASSTWTLANDEQCPMQWLHVYIYPANTTDCPTELEALAAGSQIQCFTDGPTGLPIYTNYTGGRGDTQQTSVESSTMASVRDTTAAVLLQTLTLSYQFMFETISAIGNDAVDEAAVQDAADAHIANISDIIGQNLSTPGWVQQNQAALDAFTNATISTILAAVAARNNQSASLLALNARFDSTLADLTEQRAILANLTLQQNKTETDRRAMDQRIKEVEPVYSNKWIDGLFGGIGKIFRGLGNLFFQGFLGLIMPFLILGLVCFLIYKGLVWMSSRHSSSKTAYQPVSSAH